MSKNEPNPATVAWSQVFSRADKLFDAVEALEEAGGLKAAAEAANWSPKTLDKALATLTSTRDALDALIASRRADRPIRHRLGVSRPRASA